MPEYPKYQPTPFDALPIEGLHFVDGYLIDFALSRGFIDKNKYPFIEFPSGVARVIYESRQPDDVIVHIFGELDLSYRQTRDEAHQHTKEITKQIGYIIHKIDDDKLDVHGFDEDEHFRVVYDNKAKRMLDVQRLERSKVKAKHPGHILMNDEIQAQLPPLYSNEEQGMEAKAPIKYFHVLSGWTWYASEYDPDPDNELFFGLVNGFELEMGYFSLRELEDIGADGKTLPIERDLHYEPQTLKELQDYHRKLRGY